MFSFVDLRLALLLSAAVLLVRAQGEDDRKFHHCLLELLRLFSPFILLHFFLYWVWKVDFLCVAGRLLRS